MLLGIFGRWPAASALAQAQRPGSHPPIHPRGPKEHMSVQTRRALHGVPEHGFVQDRFNRMCNRTGLNKGPPEHVFVRGEGILNAASLQAPPAPSRALPPIFGGCARPWAHGSQEEQGFRPPDLTFRTRASPLRSPGELAVGAEEATPGTNPVFQ